MSQFDSDHRYMKNETIKAVLNDPKIKETIINTFYAIAYSNIQSLGSAGLHSEKQITRQEALAELTKAKNTVLDIEF